MGTITDTILHIIDGAAGNGKIKYEFVRRLHESRLTREENPISHFCVYFAAYDPDSRTVFIGHHKKSGLWLFSGGHMDPEELPIDAVRREIGEEWGINVPDSIISIPRLITRTQIEHPEQQICEWHYDMWYFLQYKKQGFHPEKNSLLEEFSEYGWKTYPEASALLTDPSSREALIYCKNLR